MKGIEAYISVGSNIEPEKNIPEALEKLKKYVRVKAISTFYRTIPIGRPEQSAFLNGVWQINAVQTAREVTETLIKAARESAERTVKAVKEATEASARVAREAAGVSISAFREAISSAEARGQVARETAEAAMAFK